MTAVCLATASLFTLNACKSGGDAENANLTKVTIWTGDSHSKNIINGLVEEYNKTKGKELGIQVEYPVKDGNRAQNLEMAIASNQAPDFFSQRRRFRNMPKAVTLFRFRTLKAVRNT
ncbi:MAG: hypothetical protein L6V93_05965 [Clostridiales bacterium]|nr:MAG: hypothetical protein L6V93_05965 [Clostridiales bacterium]